MLTFEVTLLDGGGAGRRVVAAPQPPGRRGRVPRRRGGARARLRPAQDADVRPPGARAAAAPRARRRGRARLPLRQQRDDAGVRRTATSSTHRVAARRRDVRRRRPRQDRDTGAAPSRPDDPHRQARRLPHVDRRARPRSSPTVATARCDRAIDDGTTRSSREQREWLDDFWDASDVEIGGDDRGPAGDALEPVPARPGQRPDRRSTASPPRASPAVGLRGPLLLGHRDLRRPVPRLHQPGDGPQRCCASAGDSCRRARRARRAS